MFILAPSFHTLAWNMVNTFAPHQRAKLLRQHLPRKKHHPPRPVGQPPGSPNKLETGQLFDRMNNFTHLC